MLHAALQAQYDALLHLTDEQRRKSEEAPRSVAHKHWLQLQQQQKQFQQQEQLQLEQQQLQLQQQQEQQQQQLFMLTHCKCQLLPKTSGYVLRRGEKLLPHKRCKRKRATTYLLFIVKLPFFIKLLLTSANTATAAAAVGKTQQLLNMRAKFCQSFRTCVILSLLIICALQVQPSEGQLEHLTQQQHAPQQQYQLITIAAPASAEHVLDKGGGGTPAAAAAEMPQALLQAKAKDLTTKTAQPLRAGKPIVDTTITATVKGTTTTTLAITATTTTILPPLIINEKMLAKKKQINMTATAAAQPCWQARVLATKRRQEQQQQLQEAIEEQQATTTEEKQLKQQQQQGSYELSDAHVWSKCNNNNNSEKKQKNNNSEQHNNNSEQNSAELNNKPPVNYLNISQISCHTATGKTAKIPRDAAADVSVAANRHLPLMSNQQQVNTSYISNNSLTVSANVSFNSSSHKEDEEEAEKAEEEEEAAAAAETALKVNVDAVNYYENSLIVFNKATYNNSNNNSNNSNSNNNNNHKNNNSNKQQRFFASDAPPHFQQQLLSAELLFYKHNKYVLQEQKEQPEQPVQHASYNEVAKLPEATTATTTIHLLQGKHAYRQQHVTAPLNVSAAAATGASPIEVAIAGDDWPAAEADTAALDLELDEAQPNRFTTHEDSQKLMHLVMAGLGLLQLPNMAKVNISQQEYASKYREYLRRVQALKRRELAEQALVWQQQTNEGAAATQLQLLSIVSNASVALSAQRQHRRKRDSFYAFSDYATAAPHSFDKRSEHAAAPHEKINIQLHFPLNNVEATHLRAEDLEEANIRLMLVHSPALAWHHNNNYKHNNKRKRKQRPCDAMRQPQAKEAAAEKSGHRKPPQRHVLNLKVYQRLTAGRRLWLDGRKIELETSQGGADETHSQWLQFDVTKAVEAWLRERSSNLGLEVQCDNCQRIGARLLSDTQSATDVDQSADEDDADAYQLQPVLNIIGQLGGERHHHHQPHPHHQQQQGQGQPHAKYANSCHSGTGNQRCCRHKMEVIFKEIKGFEFILQPKVFDAGYCHGRCPPRYNPAHHHAMLQSLIWQQSRSRAPRPCCAPSKLVELEVLHVDEQDAQKLKISTWTDMRVVECACS